VSQNWAGKKWGSMFLPRIGQEVIVDFLEGDPDRPIITGRVYNGDNTPPYDLPSMQTVSTIKSNSSKGGSGFNEMRFEDKAGSEQIFVFAQKDYQQRVQNDKLEIVSHQRHITVEDQAYYHYKKNVNITSDAEVHEKIGTDYHLDVVGAMPTSIGGQFSLTVGAAVVEVFKDDHSEDCSGNYFLKAAKGLVIQCDAGISLVCGGNSVVLDSLGVTITGTSSVTIAGAITKINSGAGSSPASGSAGSADAPVDPDPAKEPGTGDPGELSTVTPPSETPGSIAPTSTTVPGDTPPPTDSQTTTDTPVTKHVEFKLLDDTEKPISGEKGVLTYPDGSTKNVTTDGGGSVKVDDPNADQVTIYWPNRKDHDWDYLRTEDC
jgi:type VI secretion system secreted protein VgrG